jgi:hypothetical protein
MLRFLLLGLTLGLGLPSTAQTVTPVGAGPLVSMPFDAVSGIIVLRNLAFNGRRGDFILDTGCSYPLVVEQAAFPNQLHLLPVAGLSVAGATPQYELPVTQFDFGGVRPPATAQATSLAALRQLVGPQLLGLIGTGLLRRFEVVIDYAHRRLSVYALDASASSRAVPRPFTRRDSLAFSLVKGWPLAVGYVGTVPVQWLLDTGAASNLLNADLARNLPSGLRPIGSQPEAVVGPSSRAAAQRAVLPKLIVGTVEWRNLPVLLTTPVRYQSGRALPYQGVLGNPFIAQDPLVSFHFGRQRFYFLTAKQR